MTELTSAHPVVGDDLFRLFADSVLDHALYTLDPAGRVSSWNRGAERMFGYQSADILGQTGECFYSREALDRREPELQLAIARERGFYEIEGLRVRSDGTFLEAYVVLTALWNEQRALAGYAVITRDITSQRRAMELVQDRQRRLQSILETAVDAVIIIDTMGLVESFNPAAERMFGYRADEMIGQNVNRLMPDPYAAEHTGYLQRYLRTGQAKIIGIGREVQARRKDGSLFPADLAVSTFHDGVQLFTGIVRDISERKAMEAEVLQIAEAEQRRIGQELHDDTQQQLAALTMIARNAADSIAAKAAEDPSWSDVQPKVERLVQGLRQANQSLRLIARGLVPVQVDSHGLSDALANLAAQIRELHGVPCHFSADKGLEVSDNNVATHLYRITQEAINNALKHASARQIDVRLFARSEGIFLEIADDGVGIDPGCEGSDGRGLQIMAYRARLIGGVCTVRGGTPTGTIVSCFLPKL